MIVFTGIISDVGKVVSVTERDSVRRVAIECIYEPDTIDIGASIACAGICLTVVFVTEKNGAGSVFEVDLAAETLMVTSAHSWKVGTRLNLERSLRAGDELGGHLVSGHVDGLAAIVAHDELGATIRFTFEAPKKLARFIATKGSVALDGTSLTINAVSENRFECLLIPHTLKVTTWNERRVGDSVHLEVDQIARYVARLAEAG